MPLSFTEKTALERGFEPVFQAEIAPKVEALQADRSGLRERTLRDLKRLAAVTAGLMLFVLVLHLSGVLAKAWLVLLPVAATGFGAWLVWRRQQAWAESVLDAVMPSFCRFLGGLEYRRRGISADHVDPFEALGLVGVSNRRQLEHLITGRHRGTGFDLVHARLSHKRGGRNRTTSSVFQGLLFRIEVPATAPVQIVLMPRLSRLPGPLALLQRRANDKLPEIAVDQPAFAEKFVVRAELSGGPADAAAARAFLTQGFMTALLAIDEAEARRASGLAGLSAGFSGDTFYLALSRRHVMSLGPMRYERPKGFLETGWFLRAELDLEVAIHGMFEDVGTAHRVIDHLHGRPAAATRAAG